MEREAHTPAPGSAKIAGAAEAAASIMPVRVNFPFCPLDTHRHQHIDRLVVVAVAHEGRRAGIGEREGSLRTVELSGDVELVARIETDFVRRTRIGDRKLLRRAAG